jgi:hypothetical protein
MPRKSNSSNETKTQESSPASRSRKKPIYAKPLNESLKPNVPARQYTKDDYIDELVAEDDWRSRNED